MANGTPPLPGQRPMIEALLSGESERQAKLREQELQAEQLKQQAALEEQRRLAVEAEAQREQQEFEQSPANRAYEVGKVAVPAVGGMYAGHRFAEGIEERQQAMKPSMRESMGVGRRLAPYAGKSMTYMLPEAAFLRLMATQMEEGEGQDLLNAGSIGLAAAGATNLGEGVVRSLTSPDQEASQPSRMAQALAGDQARDITPPQTPTEGRTALPAPEEAEAQGQSVRRSDRAKELTRVANVKGRSKLNKAEALNAVRETVEKDQKARTAVAKKLSEMGYDTKPGPKYLERISKALDDLGPKGAAAIAGLVAYDAIRGDAEAADGEQSGGSMAEALLGSTAAGGAAYGGMKGLEKAGELAARYAPGAMRMLGRAAGPVGAGLTAYDAYNAFQNADIDPGPKYPTTRDIASAYRQQQMPDPREAGTGRQASPMVRALMNRR